VKSSTEVSSLANVIACTCVFCVTLLTERAWACDASGAFGIEFGARPQKLGIKVRESAATIAYQIAPPQPDDRFDRFVVVVDKESKEVVAIEALKRTVPWPPQNRAATAEEKQQGTRNADAFARAYFGSLPSQTQNALGDRRPTGSWRGDVADGIAMSILDSAPWEVSIICQDNKRAAALQRVW
jgi:hypothetical protein